VKEGTKLRLENGVPGLANYQYLAYIAVGERGQISLFRSLAYFQAFHQITQYSDIKVQKIIYSSTQKKKTHIHFTRIIQKVPLPYSRLFN
jgi:hypothetical protein